MPVVISGWRSKIAEEFRSLLPATEQPIWGKPIEAEYPAADRYLFCHGLLYPKRLEDQTQAERDESWLVNYISTATLCDWIIANQPNARICIIGSESGYRGSFDESYAVAKRQVHFYVEMKPLKFPGQQLVAVSPGIVEDAGMTTRRRDLRNLAMRRDGHPMKRFVTAREVAAMCHDLLYRHQYVSGTVVRMHGGVK